MSVLPSIEDAYLVIENGLIAEYGSKTNLKLQISNFKQTIDRPVNSFCHAGVIHIHIWCLPQVGKREFVDKIRGMSYGEIAAKGGGF
jgi:imidazolonepropionase